MTTTPKQEGAMTRLIEAVRTSTNLLQAAGFGTKAEELREAFAAAAQGLTNDDILRLAAEVLGNPLLIEDLKQDFTVHTEARDWVKFARALLAATSAQSSPQGEKVCPTGFVRGVRVGSPMESQDWDVEFSYGDDEPHGEGWQAVYLRTPTDSEQRRDAERWQWFMANYGALSLHEKFSDDVPGVFTQGLKSRSWDEITRTIDAALSQQPASGK